MIYIHLGLFMYQLCRVIQHRVIISLQRTLPLIALHKCGMLLTFTCVRKLVFYDATLSATEWQAHPFQKMIESDGVHYHSEHDTQWRLRLQFRLLEDNFCTKFSNKGLLVQVTNMALPLESLYRYPYIYALHELAPESLFSSAEQSRYDALGNRSSLSLICGPFSHFIA